MALGVVSLAILICFLYILSIYYQEQTARLDYKMWDVNTVTVGDFTVETIITSSMWRNF